MVLALCGRGVVRPLHLGVLAVTQASKANEGRLCGLCFFSAPSMGALLRVQVPSQVDHDERSEAQLHKGDRVWEGSVEHKL